MDDDFRLPSVLFPWESFKDQAEREARETANDNRRWTEEFLLEVKQKVNEYEADLDAGWVERTCAVSNLNDVYRIVPYHFRGKVFDEKAMGAIR